MSRSRKKNPYRSDYSRSKTPFMKRLAAKRVRRAKDVPNGSGYKKVSCSWDICDWKLRWDPYPIMGMYGHQEQMVIYPDPEWKARMK